MRAAFEICATLDRDSFPLAATLLAEHDVTTNGTEDNTHSDSDDDNEESEDPLAELQSKIAALGIGATSTFKATAGDKYTADDLKEFEEHTKAVLKASREEFVSDLDRRAHCMRPQADCVEGEGEVKAVSHKGSLRIKRPSRKSSSLTARSSRADLAVSTTGNGSEVTSPKVAGSHPPVAVSISKSPSL